MPTLRDYQIEDVEKLSSKSCSACFNEQRTGKTPTAIMTMERKGVQRLVVVAPSSSLFTWAEEYTAWTGKPAHVVHGTPNKKAKTVEEWTEGALIISYGSIKTTTAYKGYMDKILSHKPDGIILDEAHRIKDHKSAICKSIMKSSRVPYRLALTGTPAPNKAYEVYSILAWLYPKTFRSYWSFIDTFFIKVRKDMGGQSFMEIAGFKPGGERKLQEILASVSTQRKRKEVMSWLPEKDYLRIKLDPTTHQKRYLKELADHFETEEVVTQGVLDRLIRYRQICLAPELLELTGVSPKLEWIKQYVTDYPEKPIIIFSKFTSFLKIVEKHLAKEKLGVIIGSTPIKTRHFLKEEFQKGNLRILLVNIDAGKEALTLDKAEVTIFTDKYPPVGDILQAEDRFIATSEDKKEKGHLIVELMMKGTYDEQLYQLLQQRFSETDVINDYKKYMKRS